MRDCDINNCHHRNYFLVFAILAIYKALYMLQNVVQYNHIESRLYKSLINEGKNITFNFSNTSRC